LISQYKKESSPEVSLEIKEALAKFDKNQVADLLLSKRDEAIKPDEKTLAALKAIGVTITSLTETLKQGQTPERMQAVERLALLGDAKVVEPLLDTLVSDKEQMVRVKAAQVLGQMKERRAVAPLLTSTTAKEKEIRLAALQALGEIRDYQAADGLFVLVSDADAEIRKAALEALAKIGISVERIKQDLTSDNWQTRVAALSTMGRLGDRQAIAIAVSCLKDKDYRVRVEAARLLGQFNDGSSVEGLLQALRDNSAEVRVQAANTLGYIGDTRALSSLTTLLSDKDNRVSIAAAEALARLKDERATQILLKTLADSDWRIRSRSAQVLARVALDGVTSTSLMLPLTTALSDKDPLVRYYAAEALTAIGTPAIPGLLTNLKSTREGDRSRAARLLSRIGKPAVKPLVALVEEKGTSPDTKVAALHALGLIGDELAVQVMVACLRDEQAIVRAQAAESLGRFSSAVEQIIQMSKASTATTREAAIEALGRMPQPQALDRLLEAITDSNAGVRLAAVRALGETGGSPRSTQTLIRLLREENSTLRGQAAASLAKIGAAAVPELIAISRDEHPSTRSLAIEALGEIGSSKAVAPLVEVLKMDTSGARGDAIEALGKIGDPQAIEPLLLVLKTGTTTIRKKAIAALSKFADRRVVEALVVALAEPHEEIRQLAVIGLGMIGDKSSLAPLERVASNDVNAEVRDAAIRAIEQLKLQSRFRGN
jgi:HEAT repeat protein